MVTIQPRVGLNFNVALAGQALRGRFCCNTDQKSSGRLLAPHASAEEARHAVARYLFHLPRASTTASDRP
jgi:hypothetical protein